MKGRRPRGHRRRLRHRILCRGAGPRRARARRVCAAALAAARDGGDRAVGLPGRLVGRAPRAGRALSPPGGSRWRWRGWPTPTPIAIASARCSWPRTAGPRRPRLKALAAAPDAADLPAPTAVLLGRALADIGQAEAAVALLRPAAFRHPGDVWVNYILAGALDSCGRRPARRQCGTTPPPAPSDPETAHELAHLLERMGRARRGRGGLPRPGESTAGERAAPGMPGGSLEETGGGPPTRRRSSTGPSPPPERLRLQPDDAPSGPLRARLHLPSHQGKADEAATEYREAIRLQPGFWPVHASTSVVFLSELKARLRRSRGRVPRGDPT